MKLSYNTKLWHDYLLTWVPGPHCLQGGKRPEKNTAGMAQ